LGDRRLPKRLSSLLADRENTLLLSVASAWEIAIKARIGKLHLPEHVAVYIPDRLAKLGIEIVPVSLDHALETASLPLHHGDPFDRLLIAQSRVEGIPVVTIDPHFKRYGVEVMW
jgi:PIN domain nuclease of toxin-antitoxin system